ncbi:MAG: TrmH family RNA methyltransferase [Acidimicrobiia bacterium]
MATPVPVDDPHDPRLADFAGLRHRDDPAGPVIAEGALVIRHLLRSPYRLRAVLVTERGQRSLADDLAALDAPVYLAPQPLVEALAGFHFHRGALASADRGEPLEAAALLARRPPLLLGVEGVNDHENLGSLFRNAAAFGVGGVVLDPTCADPLYRRSVRVSMGHVLRLPFARVAGWAGLTAGGYQVIALTPAADAEDLAAMPAAAGEGPRAVLVGAEGPGLAAPTLAAAHHRVRIPLAPEVDSLNVATAAAIALHHLARRRDRR